MLAFSCELRSVIPGVCNKQLINVDAFDETHDLMISRLALGASEPLSRCVSVRRCAI